MQKNQHNCGCTHPAQESSSEAEQPHSLSKTQLQIWKEEHRGVNGNSAGQRSSYYSSMTGKVAKIEDVEASRAIREVRPNWTHSFSQNGGNN